MSVSSVIKHAKYVPHVGCTHIFICARVWLCHFFPHYPINGKTFRRKSQLLGLHNQLIMDILYLHSLYMYLVPTTGLHTHPAFCKRDLLPPLPLYSHCLLLLSVGLPVANAPDVLQPCGLLYYTWCSKSHHQSSPQEILAVRGGAKPYYF